MSKQNLIIGQINGIYGVKGWVKIFSHTDPVGNILDYQPWLVKRPEGWVTMEVVDSHKPQAGKAIVAQLKGIHSREDARLLMGSEIAITREQLPEDDEGFYWADLIGCQVRNQDNLLFGEIIGLVETGGHDVLRIKNEGITYLIPFVQGIYITQVDLSQKLVLVDWDEADKEVDAL